MDRGPGPINAEPKKRAQLNPDISDLAPKFSIPTGSWNSESMVILNWAQKILRESSTTIIFHAWAFFRIKQPQMLNGAGIQKPTWTPTKLPSRCRQFGIIWEHDVMKPHPKVCSWAPTSPSSMDSAGKSTAHSLVSRRFRDWHGSRSTRETYAKSENSIKLPPLKIHGLRCFHWNCGTNI